MVTWRRVLAAVALASVSSLRCPPAVADQYITPALNNGCPASGADCTQAGCNTGTMADNGCNDAAGGNCCGCGNCCGNCCGCGDCGGGLLRAALGYSGCQAYGGCCGKGKLFGIFTASDCRFTNFISPMTNPVYFEDPRNLTEARVIFMNNQIPSAVLGGGDVQLFAVQLRAAITDRLSIIAVKDGYVFAGPDAPNINGWANVTPGLKYNLYANPETQRLVSLGTRVELPVGSYHALQGNSGTANVDIFLSGGTQLFSPLAHFVSTGGFRLATDPNKQNDQFWWSFHVDRRLQSRPLYGLMELNWYHWMTNVQGGLPVGGLDLYNFGSSGVAGTNIVTAAVGAKYKPTVNSEVGVCWEVPLTVRRDIIDNRITADVILRY